MQSNDDRDDHSEFLSKKIHEIMNQMIVRQAKINEYRSFSNSADGFSTANSFNKKYQRYKKKFA